MIPHTTPPAWPAEIPSARLAAHIHAIPVGCQIAILGLPDDTGVRLNSGRPGAAQGPGAFRAALASYGVLSPPTTPNFKNYPRLYDAGDIVPAQGHSPDALEETHRRVTEASRAIAELGLFPIAIGGGHDLTFPFVRGVIDHARDAKRSGDWAGVSLDAHLDVRDTPGSGMPFRRLIEDCGVRSLRVQGCSPLVNTREHMDWFRAHGGVLHDQPPRGRGPGGSYFADEDHDDLPPGNLFVSLDLDVIDAAFAPGVSAMNPCGWTPHQAAAWVAAAGRSPRVRCFDIMELNPAADPSGRTARLAAHLFLVFLHAFAQRKA